MLNTLSYWSLREVSARGRAMFAVIAFALALGIRYALDGDLPPGFPYLTFFPAVIMTAFFAGLRAGIAVAVASGIAAWYFFIAPQGSFALTGTSALALAFYAFIVATDIVLIHVMHLAVKDLQAERERSAQLAEARTLMFHELQHRVSNNLATIAGILSLQRHTVTDPQAKQALEAASARIRVIGQMQRKLHDPGLQSFDFATFLQDIASDLLDASALSGKVRISVEADPLPVGSDGAIPLGLIATELLANSLEHGQPADGAARIGVRLKHTGPDVTLEIEDNGPGLPDGFSIEAAPSLGLRIARQFADQLGAALSLSNLPAGGTLSRLTFPASAAA